MLRLLESRGVLLLVLVAAAWFILRYNGRGDARMAKRYRGRHSPDGSGPAKDAAALRPAAVALPRHPLQGRTIWVTLAASPLLLGALRGDALHLGLNLLAFAIIAGAMVVTREGLAAEAAYDARAASRRPAMPRKLFGMVLTGLGLAVAGWGPESGFLPAAVLGVVGMALHRLGFGGDPMRDKGMAEFEGVQQQRVTRIIDEGEAYLKDMTEAALTLRDRALELRVAHFAATARELFRRVQDNPATLAAVRRYLGVYLMGARDATVKFSGQYHRLDPGPARDRMRAEYEALLDDLEANFSARSDAVLQGGREDLEIEVQVLRERLAREGIVVAEVAREAAPAAPPRD